MHWLILGAFIAGAVNAVAGGGTLLTFPALLASGFTSTAANATSTLALVAGPIGSMFGLRDRLGRSPLFVPMLAVGVLGGGFGAWLLTVTPVRVFDRVVPFLILMATVLFLLQEPLSRRKPAGGDGPEAMTVPVAGLLWVVAVYGGYFGAGIGILTLAALGFLGLSDIHRMNAIKSVFTFGVNLVAAALFAIQGLADLKTSVIMAVTALIGGYIGGKLGPKIGARNVRRTVIVIGFGLAFYQLFKAFS